MYLGIWTFFPSNHSVVHRSLNNIYSTLLWNGSKNKSLCLFSFISKLSLYNNLIVYVQQYQFLYISLLL